MTGRQATQAARGITAGPLAFVSALNNAGTRNFSLSGSVKPSLAGLLAQGGHVGPELLPLPALVGGPTQQRPGMTNARQVGIALPVTQGRGAVGPIARVAVQDAAAPGVQVGLQPVPGLLKQAVPTFLVQVASVS